jgi:hypothetical protein
MSSRPGNWMIAAGAILIFVAFCCLPAAMGDGKDPELLQFAVGIFSLGALSAATGIYLKALALKSAESSEENKKEEPTSDRRIRGGCQLCATEAPVIQCKIHQLHLCGNCLARHYDARSCIYVPTTRIATGNNKSLAARARGA